MESNEIVKAQILEIVKNQLKSNKPPETKAAFERLKREGFSDSQAKQMIGQCVSVELFDILKYGKSFDDIRYIYNLSKLTEEPFD